MIKKHIKKIIYILTLIIVIVVSTVSIIKHFDNNKTILHYELKEGKYYGTYVNSENKRVKSKISIKLISKEEFEEKNRINVFSHSNNYYLIDGYVSIEDKKQIIIFNNLQKSEWLFPTYEDENNNYISLNTEYNGSIIYLVYNENKIFVEWSQNIQ